MPVPIHLDFECASISNLTHVGSANYAAHPSTDILCMAYAFGDDPPSLWTPTNGVSIAKLIAHVVLGGKIIAHNVYFELAIWNEVGVKKYGWPPLKIEQCECTMATGYAMSLPGALENLAPALGIDKRKDAVGKRIMLQLCKPKDIIEGQCMNCDDGCDYCFHTGHHFVWHDESPKYEMLYQYCVQDVIVERECHKRLKPLSAFERKVWMLDYKINQRGVRIDIEACDAAIKVVEVEKKRLDKELRVVTQGYVPTTSSHSRLTQWINLEGFKIKGVGKPAVNEALEKLETNPNLNERVRKALEIRKEAAKSSTAKLIAMKNRAGAGDRIRGMYQYHGAGTGRWAGRGVQSQNFPRPSMPQAEIEKVFDLIKGD